MDYNFDESTNFSPVIVSRDNRIDRFLYLVVHNLFYLNHVKYYYSIYNIEKRFTVTPECKINFSNAIRWNRIQVETIAVLFNRFLGELVSVRISVSICTVEFTPANVFHVKSPLEEKVACSRLALLLRSMLEQLTNIAGTWCNVHALYNFIRIIVYIPCQLETRICIPLCLFLSLCSLQLHLDNIYPPADCKLLIRYTFHSQPESSIS